MANDSDDEDGEEVTDDNEYHEGEPLVVEPLTVVFHDKIVVFNLK